MLKGVKNTVVLIKGMCRMGKVVPKQHLAFCLEPATNSNTDVVMQGLLARTFGYHYNKNIVVYIHNKILLTQELEKYIAFPEKIPSKGANLKNISDINTETTTNREIFSDNCDNNIRIPTESKDYENVMKNALINSILSREEKYITSNQPINTKWSGIIVNSAIFVSLKKGGFNS